MVACTSWNGDRSNDISVAAHYEWKQFCTTQYDNMTPPPKPMQGKFTGTPERGSAKANSLVVGGWEFTRAAQG